MTGPTPYVLALDEGTTNAKAFAVAPDGTVLASGSAPVAVSYPRPGWVEQDADAIWDAQCTAIRDCLGSLPASAGVPAGITISNQRESVVVWDATTGRALAPMLGWQDSRTAEFCDWLRSPEREFAVASTTGLSLDPMFSAPKMRYLLDQVGDAVTDGTARIGTVDSWLVGRLTGQASYVIEAGNASRTLLLDLATLDWSEEMCTLFGIGRTLLPAVVASNSDFGTTRGLDLLPDGVPVVGVLGDSHAALFGHGCRTTAEGKATYGTGSSVMIPSGDDRTTRAGVSTTLAWLTDTPMYGHEGNIVASGTAMDWTARMLGVAPGRELDALAATVPGPAGTTLVPAFTGLGAPWWDRNAVGLISGVTAGTERGHIARAALDAVAHQIADVIEALDTTDLTVLHADGGATASRLLMQRQADLLGRDVVVSSNAEVSALGAALMGFTRLGWDLPTACDEGHRYTPQITDAERDRERRQWAQALARSRTHV
ncbi:MULTISPECIES: FGGY-family carbohydrate kinase [unclassified Actinomyces]|uniref:FGGY-family carbohydrate kinase n=1 Tax=unclassified Actinomyces TaxID=2609248 RepID=UPI0020180881|nr:MULTISPECIES: FGGY-family carbohydrate kinase [unclassified Actinomyces]MCL3777323.1 FGGY-family carbohydrate kinase [Actinomyces sp. AC-20-1]MCL3789653.1 FGGY-family carbohydrate kinase [Actinomyces sp. 187325]MCL3792182.1 FGGY-family carbohydrate kinase [Actinomyces sp. 186855]MCL3794814.1 FGGY-family carbohydrate kinase [Actinomyces sp. 217892]